MLHSNRSASAGTCQAPVTSPLSVDSQAVQLSIFNGQEESVTDNTAIPSADRPMMAALPTSLIIVPTSLVFNWMNEAAKFTPGLRVHALYRRLPR